MPNHVDNCLLISGPAKEVEAFFAWIADLDKTAIGPGNFCDALIPYPSHLRELDEQSKDSYPNCCAGYNSGGHRWCIDNWGTKWGVYHVKAIRDVSELRFQSAWSPPADAVFEALSRKFPLLTFHLEWFEGGTETAGGLTVYGTDQKYEKPHAAQRVWHTNTYRGSRGG